MKDLPAQGLGTQLRHLIELLDGGLDKIYQLDGLDYRPRYTPIMRALEGHDVRTIKAIAEAAGISHSAASQTISKMISAGLVEHAESKDARERQIRLTAYAKQILPKLQARWQATQSAADALDQELAYPLSTLAEQAIQALTETSFERRIEDQELQATKGR